MTPDMKISSITRIISVAFCCIFFAVQPTHAQFYTNGDDPGKTRWSRMDSPHYRIIYPSGLDSLARVYGHELERFRMAESISSGLIPGEGYRRRTPVILHAFNGISNGSITWAPKRADLYTLQDAYDPEPMPWVKSLAVHESRHLAQMQFGYKGWLKPLTYIIGDMAVGAYSAIWPSTWFLEGDAVVAETALTNYGRGRSADFLSYYMMAFDNADWRNWYRWRYGSYRHYSPNHYALGYLTIAGTRYCFDDPLFTERYFARTASNPLRFFNTQKTVKQASGKRFKESFSEIMTGFHEMWKEEAALREPFTEAAQLQKSGKWYREISGTTISDGRVFCIVNGMDKTSYLAEYNKVTGGFRRLSGFTSYSSRIKAHDGRIWWSESIPDSRWSLEMTSRIRYYDISTGKIRNLTSKGRLFNPSISEDGSMIACTEYPVAGGSAVVMLSAADGKETSRLQMPDSLQAIEACFAGKHLAVSTISEKGSGIFFVNASKSLSCILEPEPVSIHNLSSDDGKLFFSSDRDGTMELYSIDMQTLSVRQHSSLPYGGDEFCIDGNELYFSALTPSGKILHKSALGEGSSIDFSDIHRYQVADKLSAQEREMASRKGIQWADSSHSKTTFTEPTRYRKALNILRFHSWAPVYFSYDKIQNLSGDFNFQKASVGATALFQNSLGTASGFIGYSFHNDPYSYLYSDGSHKYRHSGHVMFTYSGLYPVFEVSADFNDMAAVRYCRRTYVTGGNVKESVMGVLLDRPSVSGNVKVYIPFNFSSGGVRRGLIPQIRYTFSNDLFDRSRVTVTYDGNFLGSKGPEHLIGYEKDKTVFMQTVNASLRGYIMRPVATSGVYPRLGIGFDAGYSSRIALTKLYSSSAYVYGYGYLPGITSTQGLKLSARYQHQFEATVKRENTISVAPRGFNDSGAEYFIRNRSANHLNITADYAIPVWFGDISCFSPLFYIKNFVLTPHFDYTMFSLGRSMTDGGLFSAGATLTAKLANFLWIPFDTTVGVTFSYNGGPSFNAIKNSGYLMDNHYIGFVFNVAM